MKLSTAWLFLLLFFVSIELQYLIHPPMGATIASFLWAWLNPRGKGGWQLFRRVAWVVFFVYLIYQTVVHLF